MPIYDTMVSGNCSTCSLEMLICRCADSTKKLSCLTCGKSYKLKKFLEKHIETHAQKDNKPISDVASSKVVALKVPEMCSSCGMKFKNKNMLKIHCDTNCGKDRNFRCEQCNSAFQTIHALKSHLMIHAGIKKNLCGFCGADFVSKGQLKVHERSHTGEKPFSCDLCDKKFSYRESLVTHASTHTGIKPYFCQNCDSRFSCIGNLIKHRRARPDSCGLPIFTNKKIAPRPSVRKLEGKDSKRAKLVLPEIPPFLQSMVKQEAAEIVKKINIKPSEISKVSDDRKTSNLPDVKEISVISIIEKPQEISLTEKKPIQIISFEVFNSRIQDNGQEYEIVYENDVPIEEPMENFDFIGITENPQKTEKETEKIKESKQENDDETVLEEVVETTDYQDECISDGETSVHEESEDDSNYLTYIRKISSTCYECTLCPKVYRKKHVSIKHLRIEHNVILQKYNYENVNRYRKPSSRAKFKCKICSKKFISKNTLAKHTPSHGLLGTLIFKCSCCSKYFETEKKVSEHQLEVHKEKLECKLCDKMYSHPEKLHNHFRYAHEESNPIKPRKYCFVCTTCGKTFSSRVILSDHERSKCGDAPLYKCPQCNKNFRSLGSLKTHESVHTGEKSFCCSFCVKSFRTSSQVTVHERSHTHLKPYTCTICPSAFSHRASLTTHMSTHTGIKKYSCANTSNCTNKFSCYSNLKAHYRTHKLCAAFKEQSK